MQEKRKIKIKKAFEFLPNIIYNAFSVEISRSVSDFFRVSGGHGKKTVAFHPAEAEWRCVYSFRREILQKEAIYITFEDVYMIICTVWILVQFVDLIWSKHKK